MTRVTILDSSVGKEGCATRSLNARCGSAVIRHIERFGDAFIECGSSSLLGFRRGCGMICFLVVSTSHIGCASAGLEGSFPNKLFFPDMLSSFTAEAWMCLRSAEEVLRV